MRSAHSRPRLLNGCGTSSTCQRHSRFCFVLFCQTGSQGGFGLLQTHFVIARVKFDNQIAGLYLLVVVDVDLRYVRRNLWTDLNNVTVDECIIGRFMRASIEPVTNTKDHSHQKNYGRCYEHRPTFVKFRLHLCNLSLNLTSEMFVLFPVPRPGSNVPRCVAREQLPGRCAHSQAKFALLSLRDCLRPPP